MVKNLFFSFSEPLIFLYLLEIVEPLNSEYIQIIGRSHSLLSGVINQAKNDFACLLMELVHILEYYVRSEEEKKREKKEWKVEIRSIAGGPGLPKFQQRIPLVLHLSDRLSSWNKY